MIIAINEKWAVSDTLLPAGAINWTNALNDLVRIDSYKRLLDFACCYICSEAFSTGGNNCRVASWDTEHIWAPKMRPIELKGNLLNLLATRDSIDYLDAMTPSEVVARVRYSFPLPDLFVVQNTLRGLLVTAAVAEGEPAPEGMFCSAQNELEYAADWLRDCTSVPVEKATALSYEVDFLHPKNKGLLDDQCLEAWPYNDYGYGRWPTPDLDCKRILFGAESDAVTGFKPSIIFENSDERSSAEAQRILAGEVVASILNMDAYVGYDSDLHAPSCIYEDAPNYAFNHLDGKILTNESNIEIWYLELYQAAKKAILDGSIHVCPVCGNPFITQERRGRVKRMYCSDSCKTKSARLRGKGLNPSIQ